MDSIIKDEERVLNLMAKFRLREVNPKDYDAKLTFWKKTIRNYCAHRKSLLFCIHELKEAFRWKERVPSCLDTVLSEMKLAGEAKTIAQFEDTMEGWLSWGYRRFLYEPLSQLIWGAAASNDAKEQYVLVDLVKEFADKICELRKSASFDSTFGYQVVTWTDFRESVADICADEISLMLVVKYLKYNGLVATSQARDGEMVLKFRTTHDKMPPTVTDDDLSAVTLKKAKEKILNRISRLESEAESFEEDARKHVISKNQAAAKRSLRQKHGHLRQITALEETQHKISTMLHEIESARHNRVVFDALEDSRQAFEKYIGKEVAVDKAYDVVDQVQQVVEEEEEIAKAMGQDAELLDISEFEDELNALMEAGKEKLEEELPKVPEPPTEHPKAREETLERTADSAKAYP